MDHVLGVPVQAHDVVLLPDSNWRNVMYSWTMVFTAICLFYHWSLVCLYRETDQLLTINLLCMAKLSPSMATFPD